MRSGPPDPDQKRETSADARADRLLTAVQWTWAACGLAVAPLASAVTLGWRHPVTATAGTVAVLVMLRAVWLTATSQHGRLRAGR